MQRIDLPFELGETLSGTDDDSNLINKSWLGQVFEVPAQQLNQAQIRGGKKRKFGRAIKVVALRNESGTTLYGKRLASLTTTAGESLMTSVDGYAVATAEANVVFIDEFLATSGVADDDIFWGVIEGPVTGIVQATAAAGGTIAVGAKLVAGTGAATSGNSTAGGVAADTTPRVDEIVGTALSAMNSASTVQDVLINACIRTI